MSDVRSLLREAVGDVSEDEDALDRTIRLARRRQRRIRITALVVAMAVGALGISAGTWTILMATRRTVSTAGSCQGGWQTFTIKAPGNYFNRITGIDTLSASDIWAVGSYGQVPAPWLSPRPPGAIGPAPPVFVTPWVLHWNGHAWSQVPAINDSVRLSNPPRGGTALLDVSATSPDDVWMIGSGPVIEHWDGHAISVVPSPAVNLLDGTLSAVSADRANDAWAVGSGGPGGIIEPVIEHWDGSSWSIVPSPHVDPRYSTLDDVVAISPNDVWAVGREWDHSLIIHWDGVSWTVVPSPQVRAPRLFGVAAAAPNDVWAVGGTYKDVNGYGPTFALLEHWDGLRWSVVPIPGSRRGGFLGDIAISGSNDIWIHWGPDYSEEVTPPETLLHYDGRVWETVPPLPRAFQPGAGSDVAAIPGGIAWFVWAYDSGQQFPQPVVARYCGTG